MSIYRRLRRHGVSGSLRLVPLNIAYYTPPKVKQHWKNYAGRWASTVYDYFWQLSSPGERAAIRRFIDSSPGHEQERRAIVKSLSNIHRWVECAHLQEEILEVITQILEFPADQEGVVVEAGSFKGGSAAKYSWACALRNRRLIVFDSFEGLPDDDVPDGRTIWGESARFHKGEYAGQLDVVRNNIRNYGRLEVCEFVKGWFDDTMPGFDKPIIVAYIDVDLAASTRTCLKYLYPRLVKGGVIFSQDGHLQPVVDVLKDDEFWENEVGAKRPRMVGVGSRKLVEIWKD